MPSGSARNGEDISLLDGDITLGAGETQVELIIGALEDDLQEPDETVVIKLIDDPTYRLDPSSAWAQVTIFDSTVSTKAVLNRVTPKPGERLRIGSDCTLKFIAIDPNGYLPTASFWANGKPIGESRVQFFRAPDPGTPIEHSLVWKIDTEGPIRLEAIARDEAGNKRASAMVLIVGLPTTDPIQRSLHPADNAPADSVISDLSGWFAPSTGVMVFLCRRSQLRFPSDTSREPDSSGDLEAPTGTTLPAARPPGDGSRSKALPAVLTLQVCSRLYPV